MGLSPRDFARIEKQKETIYRCSSPHPLNFWTCKILLLYFRRPCKVDNEDFFFLCDFFIILSTTDFMLLVHQIIGIFCYCFSPPPLNHTYSVIYTNFCVGLTY